MPIYDLVTGAIGSSVAKVARATRQALERIAPDAKGNAALPSTKKSKGWRRHVRAAKARERGS